MAKDATIEKAAKFLLEESIRDQPEEKKRAFLKQKGFTIEEIEALFQNSNAESKTKTSDDGDQHQTTSTQTTDDQESSSRTTPPPIITYPEFLLHSRKPPPLVTAQRLVNTVYLLGGAAAGVYGTSKYLVQPMLESLSSARHSLHESASENLHSLNEKLAENVSVIPNIPPNAITQPDDISEHESSDEGDGARFFSRNTGTQTSPPSSQHSSLTSAHADLINKSKSTAISNPTTEQHNNLVALLTTLESLNTDNEHSAEDPRHPVTESLEDMRRFLAQMAHSPTQTNRLARAQQGSTDGNEHPDARLRAEIRSMKGMLLNARNFPASVR